MLEMTEIADRTLRAGGPALLFENPKGYDIPVLANLFGTPERVALGMGQTEVSALREVGKLLAFLKEPEPPKGLKDAWDKLPLLKQAGDPVFAGTISTDAPLEIRVNHPIEESRLAQIMPPSSSVKPDAQGYLDIIAHLGVQHALAHGLRGLGHGITS